MNMADRSGVVRFGEAQASIPGRGGERSVLVLKRGTLDVKLSLPVPPNEQTPHAQDEIYLIIRGRGVLIHDGRRDPFKSGDLLFVAAGTVLWSAGWVFMAIFFGFSLRSLKWANQTKAPRPHRPVATCL